MNGSPFPPAPSGVQTLTLPDIIHLRMSLQQITTPSKEIITSIHTLDTMIAKIISTFQSNIPGDTK